MGLAPSGAGCGGGDVVGGERRGVAPVGIAAVGLARLCALPRVDVTVLAVSYVCSAPLVAPGGAAAAGALGWRPAAALC
jgi:hypothetical protein